MAIFSSSRLADSGAGRGWWLFKLLLRLVAAVLGIAGIICFCVYYGLNSAWHRNPYYHFQNDITMEFIPLACSVIWNGGNIVFLLVRHNRPLPLVLIFVDFLIFAGFTCADAWSFVKLTYVNGVVGGNSAAGPKYEYSPVRGIRWAHAGIILACILLAIHLLLFLQSAHEQRNLKIDKLVLQREALRATETGMMRTTAGATPEPFHYIHTQHSSSPRSPPIPQDYTPPPPPPVPAALSSKEMLGGERHPAYRSS